MRRIALALALFVASPAYAGAVLDGIDDRIDVGTWAGFGSQMKDSDGWSLMCTVKTSQTSVATILGSFTTGAQGAVGTANQSIWFSLAGYTTDISSDQDHTLINFGDFSDVGTAWHQELPANSVSNNTRNRHIVTVIASGAGANGNLNAPIVWYMNATAYTSWTKPFSDGLGSLANFANTLAIGAERKNGGTWFNWTAGTFDDCRVYTRALTANEVNEIQQWNGRDSITNGLLRRWPLQGFCQETQAGDTCTMQNGPTFTSTNELDGIRRRS